MRKPVTKPFKVSFSFDAKTWSKPTTMYAVSAEAAKQTMHAMNRTKNFSVRAVAA